MPILDDVRQSLMGFENDKQEQELEDEYKNLPATKKLELALRKKFS